MLKNPLFMKGIGRKRESKDLIEERINRNNRFQNMKFDIVIKNESTIETAVDSLLFYINKTITV